MIWIGGLVLAVALYLIGPDRFLDACLTIEDLVDPRALVDGTLVHPLDAGPGRRGCGGACHRPSLSAEPGHAIRVEEG